MTLPFTQPTTYAGLLEEALASHRDGQELYQFDPLGNRLVLSTIPDDCPNPGCGMLLPHLHSEIRWGARVAPECPLEADLYTTMCPKHGARLADCPINTDALRATVARIAKGSTAP